MSVWKPRRQQREQSFVHRLSAADNPHDLCSSDADGVNSRTVPVQELHMDIYIYIYIYICILQACAVDVTEPLIWDLTREDLPKGCLQQEAQIPNSRVKSGRGSRKYFCKVGYTEVWGTWYTVLCLMTVHQTGWHPRRPRCDIWPKQGEYFEADRHV
jgi:hypothetical protein